MSRPPATAPVRTILGARCDACGDRTQLVDISGAPPARTAIQELERIVGHPLASIALGLAHIECPTCGELGLRPAPWGPISGG